MCVEMPLYDSPNRIHIQRENNLSVEVRGWNWIIYYCKMRQENLDIQKYCTAFLREHVMAAWVRGMWL